MSELSNEAKEILKSKYSLQKTLLQVLPKDVVDYLIELIVADQAHEKFLALTTE
jgi:hypothetical protein